MKADGSLRQLAGAGVAALVGCQRALALPQAHETVGPAPSPWVTVNEAGVGVTLTPHVITANGATSTQNPPPPSLTSQDRYTISPKGRVSTYTGAAPVAVATATGEGSAGAFLACLDYQSAIAPFCQPYDGAVLYQGFTYYVTWNPQYFGSDPNVLVQVQASHGSGQGLILGERVPASIGFYAWFVPSDLLADLGRSSVNMTFSLAKDIQETEQINDIEPLTGPTVIIASGSPDLTTELSNRKPNVVAIAVPVVVGVVVLLMAGLCLWSWRRHGTVPLVGAIGGVRRRSSGYGVRQSRSERLGARPSGGGTGVDPGGIDLGNDKAGIQLTDRDSWSPTATGRPRNLFREEVQRQERER